MQILFVSLGCDKNLVDTEMMLGQLAEKGYTFTDDEAEADIAVVNSCCFIGDAKEESINTILQLAELKTEGQLKALIVCGCLAQRYKDEIQTEIPEVDAIIGTTAIDRIVETVDSVLAGKSENHLEDIDRACVYGVPRSVTTGGHFAYLKIAEGCNKRCTYCVIPSVRGNYRSIPMDSLVREAKKAGGKRCEGADLSRTGDDRLRHRPLWGKDAAGASAQALHDRRACLDSPALLLSGRNYKRADSGHEGAAESLSLPGYADSACIR